LAVSAGRAAVVGVFSPPAWVSLSAGNGSGVGIVVTAASTREGSACPAVLGRSAAFKILVLRGVQASSEPARDLPYQTYHIVALGAPLLVVGFLLGLTRETIWSGAAGMTTGAALRLASRSDLRGKTLLGGLAFLG
jgi:hypothetical protein